MDPIFVEPVPNKFTVYSKSGCPNCVKAKALLKERDLSYEQINCDEYILECKAGFLQFIEKKASTKWRSFPIIFDDIRFIGGFIDLKGYLDKDKDKDTEEEEEKTLDFTSDF